MEQPVVFFKLPRELLTVLVTEWLEWKAVARWDSAICNNSDRAEWLDILKSNCMAPSISIGYKQFPSTIDAWYVTRHIRTRNISIGYDAIADEAATISWIRNTSSNITEISFRSSMSAEPTLSLASQLCNNLVVLTLHDVLLESAHWDIIRSSSKLEELNIFGDFHSKSSKPRVPVDISIPLLQKLSVTWDLFDNESVAAMIWRHKEVRSLRVSWYYRFQIFNSLKNACPNLEHLQLENLTLYPDDVDEGLALLLETRVTGLRCLIFPTFYRVTPRDIEAIVQYHGHSLRCLSISSRALLSRITNFPHLHTLVVTLAYLKALAESLIATTITHLYVDLNGKALEEHLPVAVFTNFPALTSLSLSNFYLWYSITGTVQTLHLPAHIRTVNVDNVTSIPTISEMIPNVVIGNDGAIDIFSTNF